MPWPSPSSASLRVTVSLPYPLVPLYRSPPTEPYLPFPYRTVPPPPTVTVALLAVTVFGWLESAKAWSFGDSLYWGAFTFTTIGHSPVLPTYMMGRPQVGREYGSLSKVASWRSMGRDPR